MQCNGGLVLNRDLLISSNVPSRSGCCPASPASPASPGRSKGSGARAQSPKPAAEAWHRERGVEATGAARERGERPRFRPALPRMAASKTSLPGFLEPPLHHGGRSTWDHRAMILGLPSLSELHTLLRTKSFQLSRITWIFDRHRARRLRRTKSLLSFFHSCHLPMPVLFVKLWLEPNSCHQLLSLILFLFLFPGGVAWEAASGPALVYSLASFRDRDGTLMSQCEPWPGAAPFTSPHLLEEGHESMVSSTAWLAREN